MAIVNPEEYAEMLETASRDGFAYPAINVTSSSTLNAALEGFAAAESDGIVQISLGTALFLSGNAIQNRVTGCLAFAAFAKEVAAKYPNRIALHTDHCPEPALDDWVRPLLAHEAAQVRRGEEPAFQSHMWDGSAVPLATNLQIAEELLERSIAAHTILEVEIGVVGGEEDGIVGAMDEKLYSTPEDALATIEALGHGDRGTYLTAMTFGNVHGVYKPGSVHLRPELLQQIQDVIGAETAQTRPFKFVFHGGSGSSAEEIAQAVAGGVVKMNIDTDTQYVFTRSIADHMFRHYDGVLKIDGEVGDKKTYDPRSWGKPAETAMADRVVEAAELLGSAGRRMR